MEDHVGVRQRRIGGVRAQVKSVELKVGLRFEPGEIALFGGDRVIGDEGVDPGDLVPASEQFFAQLRADEPGRPGHHVFHR